MSIPWWASDDDVIPRLVDRFVLKGISLYLDTKTSIILNQILKPVLKASTTKQSKYAIQCLNAIIADENEKMKIFGEIIDQIKVILISFLTLIFIY
jgi:hypothetical protein